jgi:SAM-dependent methyltransferase
VCGIGGSSTIADGCRLSDSVLEHLQDPRDGSAFAGIHGERFYFAGGNSYPVHGGVPLLIDESQSLFSIRDIIEQRPTTQNPLYRSRASLKNYIRQRLLPRLSYDKEQLRRYAELAELVSGGRVLVLGAGDRIDEYRRLFRGSEVITSDVHTQFGAEIVIDAHQIPFQGDSFSLVVAAQVLEHTPRPWKAAAEIERVTLGGGYIQIEVPFAFPYHGVPYDFFRFTPGALRFLFHQSAMIRLDSPEGTWSSAAIATSEALVDLFRGRLKRRAALAAGRLLLWWMKYLDRIMPGVSSMPKGLAVTYRKDGRPRTDEELLADVLAREAQAQG